MSVVRTARVSGSRRSAERPSVRNRPSHQSPKTDGLRLYEGHKTFFGVENISAAHTELPSNGAGLQSRFRRFGSSGSHPASMSHFSYAAERLCRPWWWWRHRTVITGQNLGAPADVVRQILRSGRGIDDRAFTVSTGRRHGSRRRVGDEEKFTNGATWRRAS